jgi:hypothetical protein
VFESLVRRHAEIAFEIPTTAVKPLLPSEVRPLESKPGKSALLVGATAFGDPRPFHHVSIAVRIEALPARVEVRGAVFILRHVVDRPGIQLPPRVLSPREPLRHRWSGSSVLVESETNEVLQMQLDTTASCNPDSFFGQAVTVDDDGTWCALFHWDGSRSEMRGGDATFGHHPMWGRLDEQLGPARRQWWTDPNRTSVLRWYKPVRIA